MKNNNTNIKFGVLNTIQVLGLTQWDTGQTFTFLDEYILDGFEVQFQDGATKIIQDRKVSIPDTTMQTDGKHKAWLQVIETDNETTVKTIVFSVEARKQKNDYVEPEDEPTFRQELQQIMLDTEAIAQSVRDDADNGAFDGISPTASVTKVGTVATLTVTDRNGTTSANIEDGITPDMTPYRTAADQDTIDATKADEIELDITQKTLHNVCQLLKGHEYDLQNGDSPAYMQSVPAGAQPYALLNKVGGKSEVSGGVIVHGKCDKVVTKDSGQILIAEYPIPSAVQALTGYGWSAGSVCNEIDFEHKKYIQRVGVVDMGAIAWTRYAVEGNYVFYGDIATGKRIVRGDEATIISAKYSTITPVPLWTVFFQHGDKIMSCNPGGTVMRIIVRDDMYTDATAFKLAVDGVALYYELTTPIETDISAHLSDDNYIETDAGGTVTLHQQGDTQLTLPNEVAYMIRLEDAI